MVVLGVVLQPRNHVTVFFVFTVGENLQQVVVTWNAAAVFDGARTFAVRTKEYGFKQDFMVPVVAEVVVVSADVTRGGEVVRQRHFPTRQHVLEQGIAFPVGNSDQHGPALSRRLDAELVQVVVQPSHRVLDSDVEVPETIVDGTSICRQITGSVSRSSILNCKASFRFMIPPFLAMSWNFLPRNDWQQLACPPTE